MPLMFTEIAPCSNLVSYGLLLSGIPWYHSGSFSHSLKGICVAGLWWLWWELCIGFCVRTFISWPTWLEHS
jgi:hypothetical protein